jgi:ribA/ribD-fused uncharacterized protein
MQEALVAIRSFRKTFLSNLYGLLPSHEPVSVVFDGVAYSTVEHAYVAAKIMDLALREEIRQLPKAGSAKSFLKDRGLTERPDWQEVKLGIMEDLVRQKFSNPKLAAMLLATGDEELIEGNTWGDTFWGVDADTGEGENHLGRIIMKVREELRVS